MTMSKAEVLNHMMVGMGSGVAISLIVGAGTNLSYAGNPEAQARFDAGFWSRTVPVLTIACGIAGVASPWIVKSQQKSDAEKYAAAYASQIPVQQQQQRTTQFPTVHHQPVISQPEPTPVQQPTVDLGQAGGNREYVQTLNGLFKADDSFGN